MLTGFSGSALMGQTIAGQPIDDPLTQVLDAQESRILNSILHLRFAGADIMIAAAYRDEVTLGDAEALGEEMTSGSQGFSNERSSAEKGITQGDRAIGGDGTSGDEGATRADGMRPGLLYLENYLEFIKVIISGDPELYTSFTEHFDERADALRQSEKKGKNVDGLLSTMHLQASLVHAFYHENFQSARHFYQAWRHLRQNEERVSGDAMNFRNRGLITLAACSAPDEYRWFLKMLGIRGDFEEGIGYLREYQAFSQGATRTESCLINSFAWQVFEAEEPGQENCSTDSLTLGKYAEALHDLGAGQSENLIGDLYGWEQPAGEEKLDWLDLLLGEALLYRLDTASVRLLKVFTQEYNGMPYRHYAWHKLSWACMISGDTAGYRVAREEVIRIPAEPFLDADLQAYSEASDTLPLNLRLLKARLLFDGGYYHDALAELDPGTDMGLAGERDSVEYYYRLARIYDRIGELKRARELYRLTVEKGSGEDWYLAPNAALHLGLLAEAEKEKESARDYYRTCLKINNSSYKRSIDYKARQGLRRLESMR